MGCSERASAAQRGSQLCCNLSCIDAAAASMSRNAKRAILSERFLACLSGNRPVVPKPFRGIGHGAQLRDEAAGAGPRQRQRPEWQRRAVPVAFTDAVVNGDRPQHGAIGGGASTVAGLDFRMSSRVVEGLKLGLRVRNGSGSGSRTGQGHKVAVYHLHPAPFYFTGVISASGHNCTTRNARGEEQLPIRTNAAHRQPVYIAKANAAWLAHRMIGAGA